MAKMKVHELAKELGINSKEIIETLANTEYAGKVAQSNLEDAAQEIVRNKFKKAAQNTDAPKAEEGQSEAASGDAKAEDSPARPKKKSSITAVFNAQYSKQGGGNRRPDGKRPQDGKRGEAPRLRT